MLRLAACLEEHFPHSMANAVVEEAKRRGLHHEERHAKVEYLVAHGIASSVDGEQVRIGSAHFIFEDEKCVIPEEEQGQVRRAAPGVFPALSGHRRGALRRDLHLRPSAGGGEGRALRPAGPGCAKRRHAHRGQPPHRRCHRGTARGGCLSGRGAAGGQGRSMWRFAEGKGHTVLMVGDGINDSPALSEADAGIAISDGAAIAREIADITIAAASLWELTELRRIAMGLMRRIHDNYRFVIGFNGGLIALGVAGALAPASSAMLHNLSTLAVSLRSMWLPAERSEKRTSQDAP